MKRIIFLVLILSLLLTGCRAIDAVWVNSNPPINVDVSNTVNTTVKSGNVTIASGNVSITQNVIADAHNTWYSNLAGSANFTGNSTSTLGVAGIQVSLKTDRDCTVYVQQSPTDSGSPNWDISDTFNYIYSLGGDSWTVQAVNSYVRVVVVNTSANATTYFRLQTALCPIVEAIPRSLDASGRLKTSTRIVDDYGNEVEITPFNELRTADSVKIAGTVFIGSTLDTNFVTINTTGTGQVVQGTGMMTLSTGVGANGYSEAFSARRGRFIAGTSNMAKLVIRMADAGGTTNNKRRWGIGDLPGSGNYTITDGAYFQINGTTFGVATLRGGVETLVNSGSFNGEYGKYYTTDSVVHVYEIYYSPYSVFFSLDSKLLHRMDVSAAPWTNTVTMYAGMDNQNSGGSTTNVTLLCRAFSIHRLGPLSSAPTYKHISTATTTICKYGAGTLHTILINNPTNNDITVYDSTTGSGTVIAVIKPGNNTTPIPLPYHTDFYTGLTIVTAGSPDLTIVYE